METIPFLGGNASRGQGHSLQTNQTLPTELKAAGRKSEEFSAFPYLCKAITQHGCVGSVTPRLK